MFWWGTVLLVLLNVPREEGLQKSHSINLDNSFIQWRGTKFRGTGEHRGVVRFSTGYLILSERMVGGSFTIDMQSIEVTDMPKHETVPRRRLKNHLMDEDFFYVEKFPKSYFRIKESNYLGKDKYRISGDLTIRDVTLPISFDSEIKMEDNRLFATAEITFNRQKWGVSFVGNMTDMLVDDIVYIKVNLETD